MAGSFKYGQHVREAELQAEASRNNANAQQAADDEAARLRAQWESDRARGAALDEEVSAYAATDAARTDCFDAAGLQLFNAIATGVPVPAAGPGNVQPDAAKGAGRNTSSGADGNKARSR